MERILDRSSTLLISTKRLNRRTRRKPRNHYNIGKNIREVIVNYVKLLYDIVSIRGYSEI